VDTSIHLYSCTHTHTQAMPSVIVDRQPLPTEPCLKKLDYFDYVTMRITSNEQWFIGGFVNKIRAFINENVDMTAPYFAVLEYSKQNDTPHVHICGRLPPKRPKDNNVAWETITRRIDTLRQSVKRNYPVAEGNKGHKFTVAKAAQTPSHFQYCCKGPSHTKKRYPIIVARHQYFTDALVKKLHKRYFDVQKTLEPFIRRAEKRKREPPPSQAILEICENLILEAKERGKFVREEILGGKIIDIAYDWFHSHKPYLDEFMIKKVVAHVSYSLDKNCTRIQFMKNRLREL